MKSDYKPDSIKHIVVLLAIGLSGFVIIANIFNIARIPLHWLSFLIISLIIPIYHYIIANKKNKLKFNFRFDIKKDYGILIAILLGIILFAVYFNGATGYQYLENDDPWDHALASKYVAIEQTAFEPENFDFHYLDPYPPAFDILMGVLHQLNNSMYFTLNLFNSILCGIAIIFFYLFANKIFKDNVLSVFSTVLIFALPSFMSHFIWSQTLAITLFFPAWYFLLKSLKTQNYKDFILTGIFSAAILITQPSTAFNFTIMTIFLLLIYFIFDLIELLSKKDNKSFDLFKKKLFNYSIFAITTIVLAGIYWFTMFGMYGFADTMEGVGFSIHKTLGDGDTSGGLIYTVKDFVFAPKSSKMDQPTGWGWMVSILLIPGLIYLFKNIKSKKDNKIILILLSWFIFTFLGTQGNALAFKLFPHRFWVFLAIPFVLIATYGAKILIQKIDNKNVKLFILALLIIGVLYSSWIPKHAVETSHWPPGVRFTSYEEVAIYSEILNKLPKNSRIFMYTNRDDKHILGVDQYSPTWKTSVVEFKDNIINKTIDDTYDFLIENDYDYMILGGISFKEMSKEFGENETRDHIQKLLTNINNRTYFTVVAQNQGAVLLKVN